MAESTPIEISVSDVHQQLSANDIVLIDCREPDEWDAAHIEGAILLPMSQWQQAGEKLAELSGKPVGVHCHHG